MSTKTATSSTVARAEKKWAVAMEREQALFVTASRDAGPTCARWIRNAERQFEHRSAGLGSRVTVSRASCTSAVMRAPFLMKVNAGSRFARRPGTGPPHDDDHWPFRFSAGKGRKSSPARQSERSAFHDPSSGEEVANRRREVLSEGGGRPAEDKADHGLPTAVDRVQDPDEPLEYNGGATSNPQAHLCASATGKRDMTAARGHLTAPRENTSGPGAAVPNGTGATPAAPRPAKDTHDT